MWRPPPRTAVVTGQRGSNCRSANLRSSGGGRRSTLSQHHLLVRELLRTEHRERGYPRQMHPSGILLGDHLGAMLRFSPSCISGCPRCLHCPRPLCPAQPCTRLCFGALGRLHSAEVLPREITPEQAIGFYPSQISPDSDLSCDSSSLHKGRQ